MKANNDWWWNYGVTKDPTKNDHLLVYNYDSNFPENLLGVTLKYKIGGLIDKLHNMLDKLITNRNDLPVKTIEKTINIIETTSETLKTIENCANCKDKEVGRNSFDEFRKLINEIEEYNLNKLSEINIRLNKELLCKDCKGKEIRKLAGKCGNEEIAKFLYECRLNSEWYHNNYIQWIPFDEFKNIEYLAKGGFGEVHEAIWVNSYYGFYGFRERKYRNRDKIVDILKEVKQEFIVIITITLKLNLKGKQ